jgi:dihydrofolate reductase
MCRSTGTPPLLTPDHSLEWATIDDELHTWFNDQARTLDASLYGRRMYEVMADYWPTGEDDPSATDVMNEFARIWKPMPKIVFSSSLEHVQHNSRLVRGDVGAVLDGLRQEFEGDLDVSGPNLAGQFVRRGLVDEYRLVIPPRGPRGGYAVLARGRRAAAAPARRDADL